MDAQIISVLGMALTATLAYFGAQRGVAIQIAKLETQVDTLSARVEKHNGYAERMIALTERISDLTRRIEVLEKG